VIVQDATARRRPGSLPGWLPDVVGAAFAVAFLVLVHRHIPASDDERTLDAFGYGLLVLAGGALALCRWRPEAAVGLITAALTAFVARRYTGGPVYVTAWVALFSLSWRTDRRRALAAAGGMVALLVITDVLADDGLTPLPLVFAGWAGAAVFLGDALRHRRSYLAQLEERARFLERSREEEALRRVAEERVRIARDLHDSVAHAMATINVQAGAAAHVVDRRPEAAREALAAIQQASATVLDELGAILALLRDHDEPAERAPQPGLEQLERLVDTTRAAHVPVTLDVDGPLHAVAPSVSAAAYRIVQESLTNVIRHAGSAPARVVVRAGVDGALHVDVSDEGDGSRPGTPGSGRGLQGMRERAHSTGGVLTAGPRDDGGFHVRAVWNGRGRDGDPTPGGGA